MTQEEATVEIESIMFRGETFFFSQDSSLLLEGIVQGLECCFLEGLDLQFYGCGDSLGEGIGEGYSEILFDNIGAGGGNAYYEGRGFGCGCFSGSGHISQQFFGYGHGFGSISSSGRK